MVGIRGVEVGGAAGDGVRAGDRGRIGGSGRRAGFALGV